MNTVHTSKCLLQPQEGYLENQDAPKNQVSLMKQKATAKTDEMADLYQIVEIYSCQLHIDHKLF
jgi:hypothetical protein